MIKINNILLSLAVMVLLMQNYGEALTYVNMVPYLNPTCSGESSGLGYSWVVGQCLGFKGNNFVVSLDSHNVSTIAIYQGKDEQCSGAQQGSRTFSNGGCYQVNYQNTEQWYYNGWVKIEVVEDPTNTIIYGYRETVYASTDDHCQDDYQMYFYYTNNSVFKYSNDNYYVFYCQPDTYTPFEIDCENGPTSCFTTPNNSPCGKNYNNWWRNYQVQSC
ncbi:hypothetical protein CYY_005154 [Polysphondylium violaceum]|uniref:Secreted protein n=1 Tax=Polysphondylium violaceum TaxID=133409 RepID=A0A8J4PUR4_9MYCE|nr:hypothetical protein CYY_005154 [Polysphondylium violaceum]